MVPGDFSSKELIEKAQFTATITGTAGWETINMGKKALVFGQAWYMSLPGVIPYRPDLTFEEILSYDYSDDELQAGIRALMAKTARGTVGRQFMKNIQFDEHENARQTAHSLAGVIHRMGA